MKNPKLKKRNNSNCIKVCIISAIIIIVSFSNLTAQIRLEGYRQKDINPALFDRMWDAYWISVPAEPANAFVVYHFRKSFDIAQVPDKFILHISADNRYKLFVNGTIASLALQEEIFIIGILKL